MILSEVPFNVPTVWFCSVVLDGLLSPGGQSLIYLRSLIYLSKSNILYLLPISSGIDISACVCENLLFIPENLHYKGLLWVARQAISSTSGSFYAFVRIPALYLDFQAFYLNVILVSPTGVQGFPWTPDLSSECLVSQEISGSEENPRKRGKTPLCLLMGNFTHCQII